MGLRGRDDRRRRSPRPAGTRNLKVTAHPRQFPRPAATGRRLLTLRYRIGGTVVIPGVSLEAGGRFQELSPVLHGAGADHEIGRSREGHLLVPRQSGHLKNRPNCKTTGPLERIRARRAQGIRLWNGIDPGRLTRSAKIHPGAPPLSRRVMTLLLCRFRIRHLQHLDRG